MAIDDKIKALTKQLYPTGRVWRINPNSIKEKFVNGLLASEIRAYNDGVSILDSTIPDNPNFTADDASAWEKRLGLPDGTGQSLSDRIKAIIVQLNWPGTNPAKGAIDYIQAILQAAGFNVCTQENLFLGPPTGWTLSSINIADATRSIIYIAGKFVLASNNARFYTSVDGITWTLVGSIAGGATFSIAYGAGLYVVFNDTDNKFYSSTDLVTWTVRTSIGGTVVVWKIIHEGGQFVAVTRAGSGAVAFTSPDGITWTTRTSTGDLEWRGLVHNGTSYFALSQTGSVMSSPDGITWSVVATITNHGYMDLLFANNIFVASGQGVIYTSPDGITWTQRTLPSGALQYWNGLAFGNSTFVAVSSNLGTGNRAMSSTDGINWTLGTTPEDDSWYTVCFGGNIFVAGGDSISFTQIAVMYSAGASYYHKTLADFAGSNLTQYKTSLQYGQQNYGKQRIKGVIIANSVDPNGDANFDIGDGSDTIFIGGCPPGTYINIPKSQETAFRQLIIKIKPVNVTVLLLVNFV